MCFGIYPGLFQDSYTVRRFSAAEAVRFGSGGLYEPKMSAVLRRSLLHKKQPLGEEPFSTPNWFGIIPAAAERFT